MASIRDVARAAGVSPATVSRTFTTPGLINAQTQQRVLEAARQLDYRPPRLRTPRSTVRESGPSAAPVRTAVAAAREAIGFQFFSATDSPFDTIVANSFYAPVLAGAQAEASALGMHLLLHATNRHGLFQEVPKMVQEQTIGGILLVGTADPAVLAAFSQHVPNLILVDNRDETGTFESVVSDGFGGACLATRYLMSLGHRRIGFLLPEEGVATFNDRLRGYRCALFESGHTPDPALVFGAASSDEEQREILTAFLARPERPTAVVAANDQNALHLMRACRDLGLRVPADLSIIGFDDAAGSDLAHPPLTTVRVDKEFMGRLAVRRLHARLHAEAAFLHSQPSVRHEIPVTLVVRESCRPI